MAIGSLAIAGLATAAGGALSARAQGKAADKALQASNYAADQSAAVLRENYDKSAQALAPWQQSGLGANALLNDFYGIQPQQQQVGQTMGGDPYAAYVRGNPDLMAEFGRVGGQFGGDMGAYGQYHYGQYGQNEGRQLPGQQTGQQTAPQANSRDAFRRFIENSDYGFQFGQGANRVNSGYAGAGTAKSGAAMKALEAFRQNLQQGYRGEFAAGVGQQANAGLSAASAQAGVSQSLGTNLANIAMNKGDNAANAALSKGSSGIGNAMMLAGGGLFRLGGF